MGTRGLTTPEGPAQRAAVTGPALVFPNGAFRRPQQSENRISEDLNSLLGIPGSPNTLPMPEAGAVWFDREFDLRRGPATISMEVRLFRDWSGVILGWSKNKRAWHDGHSSEDALTVALLKRQATRRTTRDEEEHDHDCVWVRTRVFRDQQLYLNAPFGTWPVGSWGTLKVMLRMAGTPRGVSRGIGELVNIEVHLLEAFGTKAPPEQEMLCCVPAVCAQGRWGLCGYRRMDAEVRRISMKGSEERAAISSVLSTRQPFSVF